MSLYIYVNFSFLNFFFFYNIGHCCFGKLTENLVKHVFR